MKQVIALFLALAVTTPAVASGRDHYKHGGYNHRVQHHHHKHGDKWVVPLIGGVILGAVINEANKPKERENNRKIIVVKEPQRHCEELTIIVQNRWGDILERRTEYRCTEY